MIAERRAPGQALARVLARHTLLEGLPPAVAGRVVWWERHVVELQTGVTPDAAAGDGGPRGVRPGQCVAAGEGDDQGPRVARGGRASVVEHSAADAPPA